MAYSVNEFQSELNNPRISGAEDATVRRRIHRGVRIIEIGVVHQIEKLSPEVERLGLGERAFVDWKYLHHGEVDIRHSRFNQQIPAGGTESAQSVCHKGLSIEPLLHLLGFGAVA
jgi:hypothetical protein